MMPQKWLLASYIFLSFTSLYLLLVPVPPDRGVSKHLQFPSFFIGGTFLLLFEVMTSVLVL